MKKTYLTLLSFLFFLVTNAQVITFLSLGTATAEKDAEGNFADVRQWTIQQMRINVDLNKKKLQFFSKGMFDRDTFSLRKEITIQRKITSPNVDNDQTTMVFSGMDERGRKCIVRFKAAKEEHKMQHGELQVEYRDRAETYRLRTLKDVPFFNEN